MERALRVKWWIGRMYWTQDFSDAVLAEQRVEKLLLHGCCDQSKAGVVTNYPAARITKITRRWVNK
jgi:hypothetical protein